MRKLVFINTRGYGHIFPTLDLVKELVRAGEKVVYYCADTRLKQYITDAGAAFRYYNVKINNDISTYINSTTSGDSELDTIIRRALGRLAYRDAIIPSLLDDIIMQSPDYIIHHAYALCGKEISKKLDIPSISFYPVFPYNESMMQEDVAAFVKNCLGGMPNSKRNYSTDLKIVNSILKEKYNVNSLIDALFANEKLNIVFTSRMFQPYAESFDDSFLFVGPSLSEPLRSSSYQEINNKDIYITLGTTHNNNKYFYEICFQALMDYKKRILLSVGENFEINQLRNNIPSNFTVKNFVPQIDVIKKSNLVVTSGGMGTVSSALYYGVPIIAIPQGSDQFMVANQVERLGAGIKIKSNELTSSFLRDTVEYVISNYNDFQTRSRIIGNTFKEAGGTTKVITEINSFLQNHSI